ncbi:MAG: discoidin domain-containing protein, partial [Clostridia bacterium]|nr:discoidin domain-containing protein [Clostridia bacterium]
MKKLLAVLLAALLVVPAVFMFSASADSTLVSAGKSYTVTGCGTGFIHLEGQWPAQYDANLTDGVAFEEVTYGTTMNWFGYYWNPELADKSNSPDGVGTVTIDLGEVVTGVNKFRAHMGNGYGAGALSPKSYTVSVSENGTDFTEVGAFEIKATGEGSEFNECTYWTELTLDTAVSARYVAFTMELAGYHGFVNELEVYADPSAAVEPEPEVQKTYENTYRVEVDENGAQTAVVDVPYGYTWTINYVNGSCAGEDATICT